MILHCFADRAQGSHWAKGTPEAANSFNCTHRRDLPTVDQKIPVLGGIESGDSCEKPRRLWRRGTTILTADFDREISVTVEYLFGLDRETDRNLGATVHNLKDMIAEQTAEFAPDSLLGNQFDTAITSFTLGTTEVGFSHVRNRTIFLWIAHSSRGGPAAFPPSVTRRA